MVHLKSDFQGAKTWLKGSNCGQDAGVTDRQEGCGTELNTSDNKSSMKINDATDMQNIATTLASFSLCISDTNLNTQGY